MIELQTEAILQEKFPEIFPGQNTLDTIKCTLAHSSSSFMGELSSPDVLFRVIPAASWLRSYCCTDWKKYILKDISAGLIIGIMLIPQAMAYSMIASLPPHYGFYSSIVPSLVYMLFGSSRHVQLGVNAPISLMVAVSIQSSGARTEEERISAALTITTLGGFAYFAMMVFRLDLVSTFIPDPVMSGFCTAMAFQIMSTNLKYAVGVHLNTVRRLHPQRPPTRSQSAPRRPPARRPRPSGHGGRVTPGRVRAGAPLSPGQCGVHSRGPGHEPAAGQPGCSRLLPRRLRRAARRRPPQPPLLPRLRRPRAGTTPPHTPTHPPQPPPLQYPPPSRPAEPARRAGPPSAS